MSYAKSDRLQVQTFSRQPDGEEVVIGLPGVNIFLAVPLDALEILDSLSRGKSIGETQAEFARAHGIEPDIDDFLQALEQRGFVKPYGSDTAERQLPQAPGGRTNGKVRYHFEEISESTARIFFGPLPLALALITIAVALAAAAYRPSLIPGRSSLIFTDHRSIKLLILSLVGYGSIFLHEFAHLLAARAQGVKSRIGLSNRLWFLVAETDMTGLWAVPRRQHYLPVLAGPLLDAFSGAVLFLVLLAQNEGLFKLLPMVDQLARALIFVYIFRLFWQCFFFMRTDFYYVFTTLFSCKNLMKDTENFVRNLYLRLIGSPAIVDQTHIPRRERQVIRLYSVLWVLGRGLAIYSLLFITLPVLYRYFSGAALALRAGFSGDRYQALDSITVGVLNLLPLLVGLFLWITGMIRKRRIA